MSGIFLYLCKKINMKEDLICYLKIFVGVMLTSPILFCTFYVDLGLEKAVIITSILYFSVICIAIPMFNYLQYGTFTMCVSDEDRKDPYRIKRDSYRKNDNLYK